MMRHLPVLAALFSHLGFSGHIQNFPHSFIFAFLYILNTAEFYFDDHIEYTFLGNGKLKK